MTPSRADSLAALESHRFDLLVIGAGIVGARVAYEAARSGATVALLDAGDFGGETSCSSSKLLHGGFRYLAGYRFGLVREAQRQRAVLAGRVAPHLVWSCPMVVALPSFRLRRRLKLATGLAVYAALAGFRAPRPRLISGETAIRFVPALNLRVVGATGLIGEMQTHDARLTLATVKGAVAAGTVVTNYVKVVELFGNGALVEDRFGGGTLRVDFRAVVNAGGPWLDSVRRLQDPHAKPLVRLSSGTHALLAMPDRWTAGLAVFDEAHSVFAVPWQSMLLVGATDAPLEGEPSTAAVTVDHVRELLDGVGSVLEGPLGSVLSTYCGVRVLPLGDTPTAEAPREHVIDVGPSGMVSVGGGKLTTHRPIAAETLRRLPAEVRPRRLVPTVTPLPGAGRAIVPPSVDSSIVEHLVSLYGNEAASVIASAGDDPNGLERIHPAGPDVWAQVRYAVEHEWALTANDVLERRTTVALRGLASGHVRAELEGRLSSACQPSHESSAGQFVPDWSLAHNPKLERRPL